MNRLLIIDDQVGILQMLRRRLTKLSYEVFTASDKEGALDILETTEIDLVLIDYMMPQMTGFDLFMDFHKQNDVPVIMMTAHSSTHLAIEFMKSGGVDFIEKPLDIDVLHLRIDRAIMDAKASKRESEAKKKAELALMLANKALREKTEILELKNKELDAFTAAISHDLKAPARSINSFIQLLKRKLDVPSLSEDVQELFHFVEEGSKKMHTMVSELLDMAKMEEVSTNIQFINTEELVGRIVDSICLRNPECKTRFEIEPLPSIVGDLILMEQVFYNLIENAIKYSHLKPEPFVKITGKKEGEEKVVFAINDNGVGFDMIYADRVFDMFVRLDTQKKFEGTGIGLANVKKIIQRHNGEIWVNSEEGIETTFFFSLPC